MTVTRIITTILPQTNQGRRIADELEEKLKRQGCYGGRRETTHTITLIEVCNISIKEEVDE